MYSDRIQAEVALYPLREPDLGPAILAFVEDLRRPGVEVTPGPMSTLVVGEAGEVFAALQGAYEAAARRGQVVLRVTLVNPGPQADG